MNWTERIKTHYEQNWQVASEICPFTCGPIKDLSSDFKVLAFPPHAGRSMWTYATCGMAQPEDALPIELHLFSSKRDIRIVELLFMVAHFHQTGSQLNLWHTVDFGRPWVGESNCTYGLISLPYLDGPDLENLDEAVSPIKFYWLIPITKDELELKKTVGIEALEARFEEANFDYSDPSRASVA